MAVHLYAVGEAAVGREVPLDLVTTEQPGTRLTINTTEAGGFHFRVEGFREENIRLVKPGATIPQQDQVRKPILCICFSTVHSIIFALCKCITSLWLCSQESLGHLTGEY